MFGYESALPGQQAVAEPRFKSFSLKLMQQIPKLSHQSTGLKFYQTSRTKADQVVDATSIALKPAEYHVNTRTFIASYSNSKSHKVVDKQTNEASCCRSASDVCSIVAASGPVKDHFSFNDNDFIDADEQSVETECQNGEVKENKVVAVDSVTSILEKSNVNSSNLSPTANGHKQACKSHHQVHVCPLFGECDWQLGQFLRCIHLNKDITLCKMFNESWKECKKKTACAMLQKAYTNCTEESFISSK